MEVFLVLVDVLSIAIGVWSIVEGVARRRTRKRKAKDEPRPD
jgi:hypothetical protein